MEETLKVKKLKRKIKENEATIDHLMNSLRLMASDNKRLRDELMKTITNGPSYELALEYEKRKGGISERTIDIIHIAKQFSTYDEIKKAIAKYMSETCLCPIERYDRKTLYIVLKNAMFDFLNHASRKEDILTFIRDFFDGNEKYIDVIDCIIFAFSRIRVKMAHEYLHGWHETEFTMKINNKEWSVN